MKSFHLARNQQKLAKNFYTVVLSLSIFLCGTVNANVKTFEKDTYAPSKKETRSSHFDNKLPRTTNFDQSVTIEECNVNLFSAETDALYSRLLASTPQCIGNLFDTESAIQEASFTEKNMLFVADKSKALAEEYDGQGSEDLESLFLFLRAGYYVRFYNNNVDFGDTVQVSVKNAIDAFVANAHFYTNSAKHAPALGEVLTTMDSAELQHVYIPVVKQWLSRWNNSYAEIREMNNAVNNIFYILFRGVQNANYREAVKNDNELINILLNFTLQDWMIGTQSEFMLENAGREMGRFTSREFENSTIKPTVNAAINAILDKYEMLGVGSNIWLATASSAALEGDCNVYNICGFESDVETAVLKFSHTCNDEILARYQHLNEEQLNAICSVISQQSEHFHELLKTEKTPVIDDNNTTLEINIFDSSTDYDTFAGIIFNIDTDNGGIYLEGEPDQLGNKARFIAYESTAANAPHFVWNLEHEFIHYLDGRFNLYGNFESKPTSTIWWSEGLAEYASKADDNTKAINTVDDGSTYTLSEIFETTYEGFDQDRIYNWGYLAVRFMFEKHANELTQMLSYTRAGDWEEYETTLAKWTVDYSEEFTEWTRELVPENEPPTASFSAEFYTIKLGDSIGFNSTLSNDNDGRIVEFNWDFGDGNSSNEANPVFEYLVSGTFQVTLTVTDDRGTTSSVTREFVVNENQNPVASFNSESTSIVLGDTIVFDSSNSTDADGYIADYLWDFGDGNSSSDPHPVYGYEAAGVFQVTLTVTDENGAKNSVTKTVSVNENQPPTAKIITEFSQLMLGQQMWFKGYESVDSDGQIVSYQWDLGDGNSSNDSELFHLYQSAGTYEVILTVTDNHGATASVSTTVAISENQPPTAAFTSAASITLGDSITFNSAGSQDSDDQIQSYHWDFGDGNTSSDINPTHRYTAAGSYQVTLTVTDTFGATNLKTNLVTVTTPTQTNTTNGQTSASGGAMNWLLLLVMLPLCRRKLAQHL